jgi:hypothetical protein
VGFDGHLNTGLTLRTVRIVGGVAEVRAGATLLYDSEPAAEEAETELKASAMIDAVIREDPPPGARYVRPSVYVLNIIVRIVHIFSDPTVDVQ